LRCGFIASEAWGWIRKIQLHSPDVVESLAEKAGRLNEDGDSK
jgi:hypothetical protein